MTAARPFAALLASGCHLTVRQLAVLEYVAREGRVRLRDIAAELGLGKAVVCSALNSLGVYLVRLPDENDRRDLWIMATPRGLAMLARFTAAISDA